VTTPFAWALEGAQVESDAPLDAWESDGYLRLLIKVKMIAQISGGDIGAIISAAAELLGVEPGGIDLAEVFPAKVWIYIDQILLDEYHLEIIDLIARVIKRILAAGVGMRLNLRIKRELPGTSSFDCVGLIKGYLWVQPSGGLRYRRSLRPAWRTC
jgi:hypothetical protein